MGREDFMRRAIELSREGMESGAGGPFGAVVVLDGRVVGEGVNRVTSSNDPTAHAEVVAIRAASAALGRFDLSGCEIYASCEPCPMCLAAVYWARIDRVYYGNARGDAARIGFDDAEIYDEVGKAIEGRRLPMVRLLSAEARASFDEWERKPDKVRY
ncbi:MAG TPA: nucleoside deaminase [Anaeromyxobacteraceae bacterium]|nr:nucleoside deaminase [Anaeromyxobacteraceae bacterium]